MVERGEENSKGVPLFFLQQRREDGGVVSGFFLVLGKGATGRGGECWF